MHARTHTDMHTDTHACMHTHTHTHTHTLWEIVVAGELPSSIITVHGKQYKTVPSSTTSSRSLCLCVHGELLSPVIMLVAIITRLFTTSSRSACFLVSYLIIILANFTTIHHLRQITVLFGELPDYYDGKHFHYLPPQANRCACWWAIRHLSSIP